MKKIYLQKLPLLLAAALQILPICRNVCTHPAVISTFAIILRWTVGATAAFGAFDSVSGASQVYFDGPGAAVGTVGVPFTYYITVGGTISGDPGSIVAGAPLPAGFTNYTVSHSTAPFSDWGVITGTPTTAMTNVLINLAASNPNYAASGGVLGSPITGYLYLTIYPTSVPVVVTANPTNVIAVNGQSVSFSAAATGTGPLTYQWFKGDTNIWNHIQSATNATYTFLASTNAAAGSFAVNSGNYLVRVSGAAGMVSSAAATLTVNSPLLSITAPPTNLTVNVGQPAVFSVTAAGNPAPSYQWYKFGTNKITGATSNSYTIASAALANAGDYSVVVTNSAAKLTSSTATLTVTTNAATAPAVTTQPTNFTAVAGQPASFSVVASGTAPLSYQWTKDSNNIPGATNSTWSAANVRLSDTGTYALIVANAAGNITSSNALLTVAIPAVPTLAVSGVLANQFSFTFTPVVGLTNAVVTNGTVDAITGWGILTNIPPPPTAASITVTDAISGDARFYRVRLQP